MLEQFLRDEISPALSDLGFTRFGQTFRYRSRSGDTALVTLEDQGARPGVLSCWPRSG